MKPKVLIPRQLPETVMELLAPHFEVIAGVPEDSGVIEQIEGLLGMPAGIDFLDKATGLKAIATISAGYDIYNVPDLTRRGIVLMNCPDALTDTTADMAFTLLLASARRLVEMAETVKDGRWTKVFGEEQFGWDVHHKTLGIVGMGRIGYAIARRGALGFGMKVLYTSRSPKPQAEADFGAQKRQLPELLAESDFVCLAVPLSLETTHLIGAKELAAMKPSAFLINISRGKVIDEKALIEALRNNAIRGAGLDVYEQEPLPTDSPLIELPSATTAPHIGSATKETRDAMAAMSADNLIQYLVHHKLQNAVNPEAVPS